MTLDQVLTETVQIATLLWIAIQIRAKRKDKHQ